jgi:hypothetical protein
LPLIASRKPAITVNDPPTHCAKLLGKLRRATIPAVGGADIPAVFPNLQPWFGLQEIDIAQAL